MKSTTTTPQPLPPPSKKRIKVNQEVGDFYEPQEQLFWNILYDLSLSISGLGPVLMEEMYFLS